ncbi:MAG: hypothetical protein ACP5GD_01885 [Candidatus Micrarchaeia archaeon]
MIFQAFVLSMGIVAYVLLRNLRLRRDKVVIKLGPATVERASTACKGFEDFAKDMLIANGYGLYSGRALEKAAYEKLGIARCKSRLLSKRSNAKELVLFAKDYDEFASCLFSRCSILHAYLVNYKLSVVYA